MAWNVQFIVGATTYEMFNGNPFWVTALSGVGIQNVLRLESKGALQNGVTDIGFQQAAGLLTLEVFIHGASKSAADGHRDTLAGILRPRAATPVKVRVTRNDGKVRQIDTYLVGSADFPAVRSQRFGGGQIVAVQLKAPDPKWYDPTLVNVAFTSVQGGTEGWQIPIDVPWDQQGGDFIDVVETIDYAGLAPVYPEIVITGPCDNPIIENQTTGETIEFVGTLLNGETWTVQISADSADVLDDDGVSALQYVTEDSDLGTFHLEPGANDVAVQILTGATTATRVSFRYYERYYHA